MFYGQIVERNYLEDPCISFVGIGDSKSDNSPLQVSDFSTGVNLDKVLINLFLEGGGGNNQKESYELAAYAIDNFINVEDSVRPFLFITGDEGFYPDVDTKFLKTDLEIKRGKTLNSEEIFRGLMKKFNVFHIKKAYTDDDEEKIISKQWKNCLGAERVLNISHPKACIDVMIGAIALTSRKCDMESYLKTMAERGQDEERIKEIKESLSLYYEKLIKGQTRTVYNQNNEIKEKAEKLILENPDREKSNFYQNMKAFRSVWKDDVPSKNCCPITRELFLDPVIAADGFSYERKALEVWFETNKVSPMTEQPMINKFDTNISLRKEVQKFYEENKKKDPPSKSDGGCLIF